MIFIGVAILVAVGLAFAISSDAGSLVGLTQEQTGQLIPLVAILIVVAGAMFGRRRPLGEMLGSLLLWSGIFVVIITGYTYREDLLGVAGRVLGELQPGAAMVDAEGGTVSFRRGIGGHFQINTGINGHTTPMIFDTGASAVVLTQQDARDAGININALRYTIPVATANGTGRAAAVTLDRVEVGGIVRNNVRAFVTEETALDTSLLGMTFLETLTRYSVSGDRLELTD